MQIESLSDYLAVKVNFPEFGKYNVKGKGMLSSVEREFVGRDEKRAPLKTPAWEATILCEGNIKHKQRNFDSASRSYTFLELKMEMLTFSPHPV